MGTSKLSNKNFMIRHLNGSTFMVEYKTTHHTCRSIIENDGSERIIFLIIEFNKTTYLRRLLNLMKEEELIDEYYLRKYNLFVDDEKLFGF